MTNHEDLASGYGIILVKRDGKVRPTDNTTKQDCYDILFKILKEKEDDEDRPTGEWKHNNFDEHYCTKCGSFALWSEEADGYYEVQSNFCPNCGADMRKGGEEE